MGKWKGRQKERKKEGERKEGRKQASKPWLGCVQKEPIAVSLSLINKNISSIRIYKKRNERIGREKERMAWKMGERC